MTYYVYRYTWIIHSVTDFSKDMARLSVSFDRISDILYNKLYEDVKFGDKELKNIKGVVEFKNVTFNYPNEGVILNDLSIKFEPNKKIAIVGASGGGKTTIFNLLTRLFDTDKGSITIDGIDIKEISEKSLRDNISIIRQDPFIFNMSIKDNFRMLDEKITLKEIRKYCKLASIDDYIMSLPKKYDTVLGEGGVNLSGGQKQRIAIARTLLKKSKIILMDEATSALDNASQKIIKDSIDVLAKDHTVLIVAHRLSTIIDADEIYVIENGKVLDHGTHESLMKSCKYYQKLHTIEDKIV
jgi:ATP-binding cassette subfamily B protein